jgi:hypothetical protein
VVYRNTFDEPQASRCNVNRPLSVIKRIGLIGAAGSQLARELCGVLFTGKLTQNPGPIVFGIRVLTVILSPWDRAGQKHDFAAGMSRWKLVGFDAESHRHATRH